MPSRNHFTYSACVLMSYDVSSGTLNVIIVHSHMVYSVHCATCQCTVCVHQVSAYTVYIVQLVSLLYVYELVSLLYVYTKCQCMQCTLCNLSVYCMCTPSVSVCSVHCATCQCTVCVHQVSCSVHCATCQCTVCVHQVSAYAVYIVQLVSVLYVYTKCQHIQCTLCNLSVYCMCTPSVSIQSVSGATDSLLLYAEQSLLVVSVTQQLLMPSTSSVSIFTAVEHRLCLCQVT